MQEGISLRAFTVTPGDGWGRPFVVWTTTEHFSSGFTVSWPTSMPSPHQKCPCVLPQKTALSVQFLVLQKELILTLPGDSPFFAVIPVNLMVC